MRLYGRRFYRLRTLAFVMTFVFWGSLTVKGLADNKKYGGEYRLPLASEPSSLDPAFITGIYAVIKRTGRALLTPFKKEIHYESLEADDYRGV